MALDDKTAQALSHYEATSLAFDEMILQVGRAVARAQEALDRSQIETQKEIARALAEGRIRNIDVMPIHGYAIPETGLEIKIGMSVRYPEGGGAPTISVVPINATTTGQSDVNVEAASEVKLRFVSTPQGRAAPAPPQSRMTREQVSAALAADPAVAAAAAKLSKPIAEMIYEEETHLWIAALREGEEPALVAVVDDRTGRVCAGVSRAQPPPPEAIVPVGAPRLDRAEPEAARYRDLVTVRGDNFLTLGGQTLLRVDGVALPILRLSMTALSFRVPASTTAGDLEIETINGITGQEGRGAFTPIPTFHGFDPDRGYFDPVRRRGSTFTVQGHNLRDGCSIRFANGVESRAVQAISPEALSVEVPEGAGSGPLTLCCGEHEQVLSRPFFVLPRVARVSPRQARVGEPVTVTGGGLDQVTEVMMGPAVIGRQDFLLQTPAQIRFNVPAGALDGQLRIRQVFGDNRVSEITTKDIFYVVPRIQRLGQTLTWPGASMRIYAEGLDADPDMMTLLFDAVGGISEAPVLAVSPDRKAIETRVPLDAATGYVQLIRKRVYSGSSHAETTGESANKITVLTGMGRVADLVVEERFESGLASFTPEMGAWRVERGRLACMGTGRLRLTRPEALAAFPLQSLVIYADLLRAESFGFVLGLPGGEQMELGVRLTGDRPLLTWRRLDASGEGAPLVERVLTWLAGKDYLLQLSLVGGTLIFSLNREEVHRLECDPLTVTGVTLISDGDNQRWDNVVLMKGNYLVLPGADYYRFGQVPDESLLPPLRLDDFSPRSGDVGTEVELLGAGLDESVRVFFNGVEAHIVDRQGERARVRVPAGASSGPIELRDPLDRVASSGSRWFQLPPRIFSVVPASALPGEEVLITGVNLVSPEGIARILVLDRTAPINVTSSSMISFQVPDVVGSGPVKIQLADFTAESLLALEVRKETVVCDLVAMASKADWSTSAGKITFGAPAIYGGAAVQPRGRETMEDGAEYDVLYVCPPNPSERALRGAFPRIEAPARRLELRLIFGMLASARPMSDEAALVDGVIFEALFEPEEGVTFMLLPRTACVHDGTLDRFAVDVSAIAGRRGRLVVSVFAGQNGLRDDAAIIEGRLVAIDTGGGT